MSLTPGVMLVTGAYFPEISSSGQQCRAIAAALRDRVRFSVITTAVDRSLPTEEIVEDVRVYRLPIDVANLRSRIAAALRVAHIMWRARKTVDVVHLHGISAKNAVVTAFARLLRKRLVVTLHTAGQDEPQVVGARSRMALRALERADLVMSVSPVLSDRYLQAGLPPEKLRPTINGIDTNRYHPATPAERRAERAALGLPDARAVLFVGFFSRDKRPDVLFDAWADVVQSSSEPVALVLVGATESPYYEIDPAIAPRIRERSAALGVSHLVRFVEHTHEIQRYYRAADVFVLPSVREALPMALLEAMASGLPSIATRLPGATDAIISDGENGLLVEADQPAMLAEALRSVLSDPARATALGAAARATIEARYSVARAADDWFEAYQGLLRK